MDYIRSATDYIGLTGHPEEGHAIQTSAPGTAVPASQLAVKKDLNDELLEKGSSVLYSQQENPEIDQLDNKKRAVNDELLHTNKDELLHSTHPDTAPKSALHDELLHNKHELNHLDNQSRGIDHQPVALQSQPELEFDKRPLEVNSPNIVNRPEFKSAPFLPTETKPLASEPLRDLSSQTILRNEPVHHQVIQKDVVVHERIHPIQKEEIQPIVYREREQLDVKQVTQMLHETEIQPTRVEHRDLPAERREAVVMRGAPIPENHVESSKIVDSTIRTQVVHQPIVNEIVKKSVIEEVQPVLERDVIVPQVVQTTMPIYEKIVEAPHVYREEVIVGDRMSQGSLESRRLSASYQQPIYNGVSQNIVQQQPIVENRRLSATYQQPIYNGASQNIVQQQPLVENRRLSATYQQPIYNGASQNILPQQQQMYTEQRQYPVQTQQYASQNIVPQQVLPTGQVLPSVQSTRPAYSYLPADYQENRPTFIGTGSQYVAANGVGIAPLGAQQTQPGIYNPYAMNKQQPDVVHLSNQYAPQSLHRQ